MSGQTTRKNSGKVLLTGASGFVGSHLLPRLEAAGYPLRLALRHTPRQSEAAAGRDYITVGEIGPQTDWDRALAGVSAVIHLAGRAHHPHSPGEASHHEAVNHQGTRRLVEACAGRVERFIFLSSLSVYGLAASDRPLSEDSPLHPNSAYGQSKARAEEAVFSAQARGWMETVSLRPPLIYGPSAPGNLARLVRAIQRGVPLPLAAINNQRSLIGVDHLADILIKALQAEQWPQPAYLIADDQAIATPDMVRALAQGLGRRPRLWPLPPALLQTAGRVLGRRHLLDTLCGDLVVDNQAIRRDLAVPESPDTFTGLVRAMQEA